MFITVRRVNDNLYLALMVQLKETKAYTIEKHTTKQTNNKRNKTKEQNKTKQKQKQLKASHNSLRCWNHTIVFVCPYDHLYWGICIPKTPQLRNHRLRFVYLIIVRSCTILIYHLGDNISAIEFSVRNTGSMNDKNIVIVHSLSLQH